MGGGAAAATVGCVRVNPRKFEGRLVAPALWIALGRARVDGKVLVEERTLLVKRERRGDGAALGGHAPRKVGGRRIRRSHAVSRFVVLPIVLILVLLPSVRTPPLVPLVRGGGRCGGGGGEYSGEAYADPRNLLLLPRRESVARQHGAKGNVEVRQSQVQVRKRTEGRARPRRIVRPGGWLDLRDLEHQLAHVLKVPLKLRGAAAEGVRDARARLAPREARQIANGGGTRGRRRSAHAGAGWRNGQRGCQRAVESQTPR